LITWVKNKWFSDETTVVGKLADYISRITEAGEKYKTQEMLKCIIVEFTEHKAEDPEAKEYAADIVSLNALLQKVSLWSTSSEEA
jgi:hypothetical protein